VGTAEEKDFLEALMAEVGSLDRKGLE
jgi:hypothetical protein